MARHFIRLSSNSLRRRIRSATGWLAGFALFCGLLSFPLLDWFGDSLPVVFTLFAFLSLTILFFGRWLANEVVNPVEKVSLLAKSFERGVSTTVPKTSGAIETDEIVQTIARLGEQVQRLVSSMDEAAAGNISEALRTSAGSDRVSQTFQKLLTKVSESISAQQNLDQLEEAVRQLAEESATLRSGNFNHRIKSENEKTREIAQTIKYLADNLSRVVGQVKESGKQTGDFTTDLQKNIKTIMMRDESRIQEMNQATIALRQVPGIVQKISDELQQSSASADQSIQKARAGTQTAQENQKFVGQMRQSMQEIIKRVQRLAERSQEIGKVAGAIEDLANRTNLVALNASVQANELGEAGRGFVVVSGEVERLAARAQNTNRNISTLNKNIQTEITEIENGLNRAVSDAATLSRLAIETGNALEVLEKHAAGTAHLQNKIADYSRERADDADRAFRVFADGVIETEKSLHYLKDSTVQLNKLSAIAEDLQETVADFKSPAAGAANSQTAAPVGGEDQTVSL